MFLLTFLPRRGIMFSRTKRENMAINTKKEWRWKPKNHLVLFVCIIATLMPGCFTIGAPVHQKTNLVPPPVPVIIPPPPKEDPLQLKTDSRLKFIPVLSEAKGSSIRVEPFIYEESEISPTLTNGNNNISSSSQPSVIEKKTNSTPRTIPIKKQKKEPDQIKSKSKSLETSDVPKKKEEKKNNEKVKETPPITKKVEKIETDTNSDLLSHERSFRPQENTIELLEQQMLDRPPRKW
ncbi:MAG: hypothetical protein H7832_14430 [Magnetococcus sp. DMHC-6]